MGGRLVDSVVGLWVSRPWTMTVLAVVAVVWVLGRAKQRRRRHPLEVGVAEVGRGVAGVWRHRRHAPTVLFYVALGAVGLAAGAAVVWLPYPWRLVVGVAAGAGLWWLAGEVGSRAPHEWWQSKLVEWRWTDAARASVPGASVRVRREEDGWAGTVRVPHGARAASVDAEVIGAALNRAGDGLVHVEAVPGRRVGEVEVRASEVAPLSPWERLMGLDNRWPGPSSSDPDAPIPVGVGVDGRPVTIPVPGPNGHLLIGGRTRGGKSVCLNGILAELAAREHTAIVLFDPKRVELGKHWARAAALARGADDCADSLPHLVEVMEGRYRVMAPADRPDEAVDKLPAGPGTPRVIVVVDELADLSDRAEAMRALDRLARESAAAGIGLILATQKPSAGVLPTTIRDNMTSRIAFAHKSSIGSRMTLGDDAGVDASGIPMWAQGCAYVDTGTGIVEARAWNISGDEARENARAHAHLRVTELGIGEQEVGQ